MQQMFKQNALSKVKVKYIYPLILNKAHEENFIFHAMAQLDHYTSSNSTEAYNGQGSFGKRRFPRYWRYH